MKKLLIIFTFLFSGLIYSEQVNDADSNNWLDEFVKKSTPTIQDFGYDKIPTTVTNPDPISWIILAKFKMHDFLNLLLSNINLKTILLTLIVVLIGFLYTKVNRIEKIISRKAKNTK